MKDKSSYTKIYHRCPKCGKEKYCYQPGSGIWECDDCGYSPSPITRRKYR